MLVEMGSIVSVSPTQANVHSSRTCRLLGFISRKRDVLRHLTQLSAGFKERSTCRTLPATPSTCFASNSKENRTHSLIERNTSQPLLAEEQWRQSPKVSCARTMVTDWDRRFLRPYPFFCMICFVKLHQAPHYLELHFQVNPSSSSPTNLNEHDVCPETVYDETDI